MDKQPPDDPPDIADASLLFGEEPPAARAGESPPSSVPTSGEGYDLDRVEEPSRLARKPLLPDAIVDAAIPTEAEPGARRFESRDRVRSSSVEGSGEVTQVWTRGAEWGPDLVRLGLGIVLVGALAFFTFSMDALALWLLIVAAGVAGLILIAYPMLITLERPVRVTPEQSLTDYFGALNHFRPHYRRMWLLLSDTGKAEFGDFDGLRAYWGPLLADWKAKAKQAGLGSNVRVLAEGFKSEGKSAGLSRSDGTYTARVVAGEGETSLAQSGGRAYFVRGSDRMWYLETGKLPRT